MRKLLLAAVCLGAVLISASAIAGFEGEQSPGPRLEPDKTSPATAVLRFSGGYDSNVVLAPDISYFTVGTGSAFFAATFDGSYRMDVGSNVTLGAALRLDKLAYTDSVNGNTAIFGNFDDYNLTVVQPAIFLEKPFGATNVRAVYDFRFEESQNVDGIGVKAHSFSLGASHALMPETHLMGGIRGTWNDYGVVFPVPNINDRDGRRLAGYFGVDHAIIGGAMILHGMLTAATNDANGRNWDYSAFGVSGGASVGFTEDLYAIGNVGFEWRDYRGFISGFIPPPGRERQEILSANAKLVYAVTQRLSLDLFIEHQSFTSNQRQFEADRTVAGLGLTIKLL